MSEPLQPWALVVDDEPQLLDLVDFALTSQGFVVDCAKDVAEAWEMLQQRSYDIVILDIVMPGASGVALCQRIRAELGVPVILLTALSEPHHRVTGLEAGADDYVAKPFHPRELALRAWALYRRASRPALPEIVNGPLRVVPGSRHVTYQGVEVRLSETEFRICQILTERAGRPVTHTELLSQVWGYDDSAPGGREMLKTAVYRLRWQLAQVNPVAIVETVRNVGYMMLRLSYDPATDPTDTH